MVSLRPQTIFKFGHSYLDKNGDGATRGPFTPIDPIIGKYGYEHHAPPIADPAPAGCGPGRLALPWRRIGSGFRSYKRRPLQAEPLRPKVGGDIQPAPNPCCSA